MGFINLFENDSMMREMSQFRPLAAFPFAGRYRLIDFMLSNMINANISNVAILPRGNYRSLVDHLRSGKDWDLARKKDGLFILPSFNKNAFAPGDQVGFVNDLEDYHHNLDYLRSSSQKYVFLTGSSTILNLDCSLVYDFHLAKRADITFLYKEYHTADEPDFVNASFIDTDEDGRVTKMEIAPTKPCTNKMCLRMFLLERQLLIDLIDSAMSSGGTSFIRDCFLKNLPRLKAFGYPFNGYVARIHSYPSYFRHSMNLLKPEIYQELFFQNGSIYTKVKDEPPAKYLETCNVQNSLVANGCLLGGEIQNSILFRGVKVKPGAKVVNSILMQKTAIGRDVVLENVICDKDVYISDGKRLRGEVNHPIVIEKGSVI
jgi:glucose-1-phosphate adenylyltransferase